MLLRDCTGPPVRIRYSNAERALSKPRFDQHALAVSGAFFAHDRKVSTGCEATCTFYARAPDTCPFSNRQVVAFVSKIPGCPITRLRNPLIRREENRLHEDNATDLPWSARTAYLVALTKRAQP